MISKFVQFLRYDLWRIRARKISGARSIGIRALRVFILSLREFGTDNCALRASALTFYSLLSIVPVFAMAFGIAKGFGLENTLETRIMERLQGQEEVARRAIEVSRSMLENTQGGVIAGIGVLFLFWTVVRMLGNIEQAFNQIWGVKEERSLGRKFTEYLSLMVICPILIIFSGSVTVFITTQVTGLTHSVKIFGYFSGPILTLLGLLPVTIVWGLLTFLYIFMPNTKVKFPSAVLGGIIAGSVYQMVQWVYIHFQIGVSRYGAIYGSFAALPLFLMWLQISWLIVLYGAEIAFAHQNEETYELEPDCLQASQSLKKVLALEIVYACLQNFIRHEKPLTLEVLSDRLDTPVRLARQILFDLVSARVLAQVKTEREDEWAFQPAVPVEELTIKTVLDALDNSGLNQLPMTETREIGEIRDRLKKFDEVLRRSSANSLLKDL